ncbi:MAG: histidine kinase [Bacteroidota bacterium]
MLRSGIDSQRISSLVEYLRPLIFSPENERLLDDWYANNSKWIAFFGDAQNVVFCAKLIYEECKAANDLSKASWAMNSIGRLYAKDGEYVLALEAAKEAYELGYRAADSTRMGWGLNHISLAFLWLEDFHACLDYADRTLEIARAIDDKAIEATIIGVIAGVKSYQDQDYEASMLLVKQSLDIARQNNLPHTAKRAIINIAYTLNNLGRYDEAVEFLTDNTDIQNLSPSMPNVFLCYNLHNAYLGKEDFERAAYYLDVGFDFATEMDYRYGQLYGEQYRTTLYKRQGLYEQALEASERTQSLQSQITALERTSTLQSLKTRIRLSDKDLEIERIDQARLASEQKFEQQLQQVIFLGVFLVTFIPGIYLLMRNRYRAESAEQQKEIAEAKLQVLQSQMHPHFMFNALGGVQNYILKSEKIEAYNYMGKFATLLRTITKTSNQIHIEIDQEIEFLESYLEMEKLRFRDDFHYDITVDPEIRGTQASIPSMVLQPLVENALIHGLTGLDRKGILTIDIHKSTAGEGVFCTIEDNGRGRKAAGKIAQDQGSKGHLSIATVNMEKRLEFLRSFGYKDVESTIEDLYKDGKAAGTKVGIYLPFMDANGLD